MPPVLEIADLKQQARRRVPKLFFDYVDSGSYTESTYRANEEDFRAIQFRQRVMVDVSSRSQASTMMSEPVSMPVGLAPTGLCGMQRADGEILAAKAAEAYGVPYILSTMSICSIEDVAAHTTKPFWFQLYVMRDRDFVRALIERARKAKCSVLVLTVDLAMMGQRHKDRRNGLSAPPRLIPRHLMQMAMRPGWCLNMATTRRWTFGNIYGHVKEVTDLATLNDWTMRQHDDSLTWADVAWIKEQWGGPLIVKGVLDPDDALAAVDAGADGVIVSNHGGRQLDGAPSTISALPAIVSAVGDRTQVFIDSGIRSGQDVLRALALGAKGTFIGRAFLWGLAARGQPGVTLALDIIRREMDVTMGLCSRPAIADIDGSMLMGA
ncbi:alpha-hydroxy acid oxidase [Rhizobium halophytocola]|uniref:L-lactate dehydrogenase (Cytochrome) n=1 Tax=Rhizobium halophytocola TaxID=735519 RepID=A0ABS4DSA9_9HYPH|nr:alpha-hydroxy acid oxidase [Rhizobium halophytocola]MBP1848597.1 L-lactate dehydrogenase (cytochrome) [Rhizobium halophytocola]